MQLNLVVDNYATHKHPSVQAWLDRNPRITCQPFTSTKTADEILTKAIGGQSTSFTRL